MTLVSTISIEFLTLCQGRAPIMWTCAIQNTSWHNHLPPQTIYHWRTSSFIVQKSSRCPRDKTNGLLLIHYLLNQSIHPVLIWKLSFCGDNKLFVWPLSIFQNRKVSRGFPRNKTDSFDSWKRAGKIQNHRRPKSSYTQNTQYVLREESEQSCWDTLSLFVSSRVGHGVSHPPTPESR